MIREDKSEIVYTLRMRGNSFTPRVREAGNYTVRLFDPDGNFEQVRKNQKVSA